MTAGEEQPAQRRPWSRATALLLGAAVLATLAGTLVVPGGMPGGAGNLLAGLALMSMIVTTAVVGLLIAWHQPANRIGWILLAAALLYPLGLNAADYSAFYASPGSGIRWAAPAAFLLEPLWISPVVLFPLVLLVFPDGRLPSPRWKRLVWAAAGAGLLVLAESGAEIIGAAARHQFTVTAQGTLAAAALFTPLRRRVQHGVDRRFNRARYDADAAVEAFATRLAGAVALPEVQADLLAVVGGAPEPAHLAVWIAEADR